MNYTKTFAENVEVYKSATFQTPKAELTSDTIAADGVWSTGITNVQALLSVTVGTESTWVSLINDNGTKTTQVLATNATFNKSKDNASTINVYWETDQLKVQNKTASGIVIKLSGFLVS